MKKRIHVMRILLAAILLLLLALLWLFWRPIQAAASVRKLEDGLYAMNYHGDYSLEQFLAQGGADSDLAVADFVIQDAFHGLVDLRLRDTQSSPFGCSTLAVRNREGHALFGRNFDWGTCTAYIVTTRPAGGYASVSTVNMDFLTKGLGLSDGPLTRFLSVAAPYAPMDGMNEKGLCVAVLMIQDSPGFQQDEGRPDLTTTTAVRVLLDKAANVEEALALLEQYDLHASAGMMVHFALADAAGRSVAVEYIDGQMSVIETPVVTNFYLTPGEKQGIGTEESKIRYDILDQRLAEQSTMELDDVRDALDRVSKHNFDSVYASTEWSIVYDQTDGLIHYYHRENYEKTYPFDLR